MAREAGQDEPEGHGERERRGESEFRNGWQVKLGDKNVQVSTAPPSGCRAFFCASIFRDSLCRRDVIPAKREGEREPESRREGLDARIPGHDQWALDCFCNL